MFKPKITAHCIIKNEENWIWYAIISIIDYVDNILVFDTGSTDNTVKIVKSIKSPKIALEKKGAVDKEGFTKLRQEMLDKTETGWFLILDGDDIWAKSAIVDAANKIKKAGRAKDAVIIGQWACLGDVYHYFPEIENIRNDKIAPKKLNGWMSARLIRNFNGLHCSGIYGHESYADGYNLDISRWNKNRLIFAEERFFHMSFLPRSQSRKKDREVMMRGVKTAYKKGKPFPKNINYPEVFYKKRPDFVPSPWRKMTITDQIKGAYFRTQNLVERHLLSRHSQ